MSVDTCVVCGEVVPEGRMVCPRCEAGDNKQEARGDGK